MDDKTNAFSQGNTATPPSHSSIDPKRLRLLVALTFFALQIWQGARYLRVSSSFGVSHSQGASTRRNCWQPRWPVPPDMSIDKCAAWAISDGPSADARFDLPFTSVALFLLSRGAPHASWTGAVNFLESPHVGDSVRVYITAHFAREEQLAVPLRNKFWDERKPGEESLRFEVTVIFPRTDNGAPLSVNQLWTELDLFSHNLGDMPNIVFSTLSLYGSLGGIHAEVLTVRNATLKTSIGFIRVRSLIAGSAYIEASLDHIEGSFNISQRLMLANTIGGIYVDVALRNDDEAGHATLGMHSNNGNIRANVTLASEKAAGAAFDIAAHTSGAGVELDVHGVPLDSVIVLGATTSIGAVSVKLPPTSEGTFSAGTTLSPGTVRLDDAAKDPAGEKRVRSVEYEQELTNFKSGSVAWSNEGRERGAVSLRTSMASVALEF